MRILLWATTMMLRTYPVQFRHVWAAECLQTFRERCDEISRTRGPVALMRHAIAEWVDMVRTAIHLRRTTTQPGTSTTPRGRRPVIRDVRSAVRSLRATPAHTAIALVTLSLGIGANTGLFSVLDSLLFRPLPFADAARLAELYNFSINGGVQFPGYSKDLLLQWRAQTDLFDRVEGYDTDFAVFDGADGAEIVDAATVTPGLFAMLGVAPIQGRLFAEGDGLDGTDTRVLISERVRRERFGARTDLVGSTLRINGGVHDIVGIMPAGFLFPYRGTEMWTPRDVSHVAKGSRILPVVRLAQGVRVDAAAIEVSARGERLQIASGGDAGITASLRLRSLTDTRQTRLLQVLGAAVAFLLLIVCANLANLSLSKALSRARDAAVRAALGASRRDLVREALAEHVVIGHRTDTAVAVHDRLSFGQPLAQHARGVGSHTRHGVAGRRRADGAKPVHTCLCGPRF